MRLREVEHLRRQSTIDATLSEAVTQLPARMAIRNASGIDDRGSAGYFEDDVNGDPIYHSWFRAGDVAGGNKVKPY